MVRFTTGLTGCVDNSWFSVVLVVCTFGIAITKRFLVLGVRVCLITVTISIVDVTGTIFVGVFLVCLFLELTKVV